MGWEERMRATARTAWSDDVRLGEDDGIRFGDVRAALAALDAARAEIERLRAAAADERADVVAFAIARRDALSTDGSTFVVGYVSACHDLASDVQAGAHVGAAKGGER